VGPIQLIAAPDLASRLLDPDNFLEFVRGRLRRRFLIEPSDLAERVATLDERPDPDGRYRVNELFCGNDSWQAAVRSLMERGDLVAMDLRGFAQANQGCVFELQSLINIINVQKIVLLVDETTDTPFLEQTLNTCWQTRDAASPNQGRGETLTLLKVGKRDVLAVEKLLAIADEVLLRKDSTDVNSPFRTLGAQPVA
jgi:hypothetical protein